MEKVNPNPTPNPRNAEPLEKGALFNLKPSPVDERDFAFEPKKKAIVRLPASVDLSVRWGVQPYHQYDIGSCTANAMAGAIQFLQKLEKVPKTMPSRLFTYYITRELEGTTEEDGGAYIRNVVKATNKQGFVFEKDWKYTRKNLFAKPKPELYTDAATRRIERYEHIEDGNVAMMQTCLAEGFPFLCGMIVFARSFNLAEHTGVMPMPTKRDESIGGHAVLCVGYDMAKKAFKVRNSYGKTWGEKGYFWLPFDFADNPQWMWDCWVVRDLV